MKILRAARRAIAVLAAAGIIFSAQGLVSYAGTTGVGAAQPEQGGPGVETGGGTVPVVEIGPGVSELQTPVPSQSAEPQVSAAARQQRSSRPRPLSQREQVLCWRSTTAGLSRRAAGAA